MHIDATAYWQAGVAMRTGRTLYAATPVAALDKAYLYPPAFAAAFAPLTLLSPVWGYAVWMALLGLCAIALATTCAELAGLRREQTEARRTALALALAAGIAPVFDNFAEGQVNLLVTWLSAVALLNAERGRDRRAAFALAAAVHVKLVPIVLAGAFVVWRRPKLLAWLAVALVAVGCLPLAWRVGTLGAGAGLQAFAGDYADFWGWILWPGASAHQVAGVPQLFAPNFSWNATLSRLFVDGTALSPFPALAERRGALLVALPPSAVHAVSTGLGLALLTVALWLCHRTRDDASRRVAAAGLVLLAAALAAPSCWQHHLVVLAVAGAGLWRGLAERRRRDQRVAWTVAILPLVATLTIPFGAALVAGGVAADWYRDLREYGVATAAAFNAFVVVAVVTATPRRA